MSTLRTDLQIIADLIQPNTQVLDVGCGDGQLLSWLAAHKNVHARGLEAELKLVRKCVETGVAVVQGDAEVDLEYYPKKSYDYVVLSRTLQTMLDPQMILNQIVDIGKQAIVSIPNFAYWKNRLYLGFKGRMPVTSTLTYEWYNTPNIHFCTLKDFVVLCQQNGIQIHQQLFVTSKGVRIRQDTGLSLANLTAEQGIFVISR